jgi:hypothetical protein
MNSSDPEYSLIWRSCGEGHKALAVVQVSKVLCGVVGCRPSETETDRRASSKYSSAIATKYSAVMGGKGE